ncbi:MAG: hypothetical protein KGR18_09710 [Acidobacteria bacterium]|nr:hypothetical protein [Acidobacteriota bacterium]
MSRSEGDPQILVVCTANICRSPILEGMLARSLADAGAPVGVLSAGLLDWDTPVDPGSVRATAQYGIDISRHRSRPVSTLDLGRFDLVLTMTREHVRGIVERDGSAYRRSFTVKEFSRRLGDAIPPIPGGDLRERVEHLSKGRTGASMLGSSSEDDIADPHGGKQSEFDTVAEQLHELVIRITPGLVTLAR